MLKTYFRLAWRNLMRRKVNTTINVLGLTLGITACLIIYLLVSHELSYDRHHQDSQRLYRVVGHLGSKKGDHERDLGFVPVPLPDALRELRGIETVAPFYIYECKVQVPLPQQHVKAFDAARRGEEHPNIIVTQPQYFQLFHYKWLAGNSSAALNAPNTVVLTSSEAARYFGPMSPDQYMGRQLVYADSLPLHVSGIVEDWKDNSDMNFRDFISYATIDATWLKNDIDKGSWGMWDFESEGYVRLDKGVTPKQVEQQFPAFVKKYVRLPPDAYCKLALQPISDIHFNEKYTDDYSRQVSLTILYGLMGIALFILAIAAINFINLSTAQSVQRAREVGVRKVLGSTRGSLVRQFMTETFLIVLASVLLAMSIANPVLQLLQSLLPAGISLHLNQPLVYLFLMLVVIVTCLLAGAYPAWVLSAFKPVLSLKGEGASRLNNKSYLRRGLIVFQFTISLLFIISTIVVEKQMHYALNSDLGFDKDAIVVVHLARTPDGSKKDVLTDKFRSIAGIQLVTRHMETPSAKGHPGTFIRPYGGSDDSKIMASLDFCDTNYIHVFGLQLIAGRNVFASDTIKEFLVNETCAKQLGFRRPEDALGRLVETGMNNSHGPIVGVIKDFHSSSLHEAITPFFISTLKQVERTVSVKLATTGKSAGEVSRILSQMKADWKSVYPDEKWSYTFFDETIARLYDKEAKTVRIMNIAMAIAILISCMGLFGLAAFTAEQRTREIGIRKVLGANVSRIVSLLTIDFVKLVLIAILVASPIAWYAMHQWLQDFAYHVGLSWWIFALAGLCAIVIALLTVSVQAIRAAIVSPVKSLRSE